MKITSKSFADFGQVRTSFLNKAHLEANQACYGVCFSMEKPNFSTFL